MRAAKALKAIDVLRTRPSFTAKEAREFGVQSALLSHYVNTGRLERVRHGVYRHPDAPEPSNVQWVDLAQAALAIPGGTICLISALAIYGLTEEIPRHHWIAVRHDTSIRAKFPIKIVRFRNVDLGRTEINLDGIQVPIFERERAILDAFRQLGREIAIKALKAAMSARGQEKLNLVKLQKYAKKLRVPIEPYLMMVTT